ncbi:hypothetical protein [Gandjariella thermophila]|uniref:Uncharacterized protein n=1 Tax=Gandjariella thermophila TaxID=1931992 RepID=A0A4D4J5S3_9PSEU|nr:hypothetical protein [Gandjariella thermophila]GDY29856.1 hypothetical protein GTS_14890 [Gandjariella thermophila]
MTAAAGFAFDPIASHSGQFPLGAPFDRTSTDQPSRAGVRPWALRGMLAQPPAPAMPA